MDCNRERRMQESNPRLPYPTLTRQPTNPNIVHVWYWKVTPFTCFDPCISTYMFLGAFLCNAWLTCICSPACMFLKKIMDFWVRWWYYICQQLFFTKRQIYLPNHLSFETYPNGLISIQSGSQHVRPPVQFSLAQLHNAKISAFTRVERMTKWLLHSPVNHWASSFLLTRRRLD